MPKSTKFNKARAGRQRIEIKRISNEESRQVCFSKRRNGLIKKAGELCILCGSSVAIIAFSPGGKAFSYGHPSLEAVLDRLLDPGSASLPLGPDTQRSTSIQRLQALHDSLLQEITTEKRRRNELQGEFQRVHAQTRFGFFWDSDIKELNAEQLEEFMASMRELISVLDQRARELMANTSRCTNDTPLSDRS